MTTWIHWRKWELWCLAHGNHILLQKSKLLASHKLMFARNQKQIFSLHITGCLQQAREEKMNERPEVQHACEKHKQIQENWQEKKKLP